MNRQRCIPVFILFFMLAIYSCDLNTPPSTDSEQEDNDTENNSFDTDFISVDARWFIGTDGPDNNIGQDGDLFLNTDTGDVFVKRDGSWTNVTNIQGPAGEPGQDLTINYWVDVITSVRDTSYMIALRLNNTSELELIGSGVAVDAHQILTNAHVYYGLLSSYIIYKQLGYDITPVAVKNGEPVNGSHVYALDTCSIHEDYNPNTVFTQDIAFFDVDDTLLDSIDIEDNLSIRSISVGQSIGTLGFPGETSERISYIANATFKDGVISALSPFDPSYSPTQENTKVVQHNFDTTGGTSGSPIFDSTGSLIALHNSGAYRFIWDDSKGDFTPIPVGSIGYGIRADVINDMYNGSQYLTDTISSWYIPNAYYFEPGEYISLVDQTNNIALGITMAAAESAANTLFEKDAPDEIVNDENLVYTDNHSYYVILLKHSDADELWSVFITDCDSSIYLPAFRDSWGITIGTSRTYILNTYGYNYINAFSSDGDVYYYNYTDTGVGFGFSIFDSDWNCDTIQIALPGSLSRSIESSSPQFPNQSLPDRWRPTEDTHGLPGLEVHKIFR